MIWLSYSVAVLKKSSGRLKKKQFGFHTYLQVGFFRAALGSRLVKHFGGKLSLHRCLEMLPPLDRNRVVGYRPFRHFCTCLMSRGFRQPSALNLVRLLISKE